MAKMINISTKRLAIDRAQTQVVAVVAVASFVTVFCLVAAKSVISQNNYQARVISKQNAANKQLKTNVDAFATLQKSYDDFESKNPNAIGGDPQGTGGNDGTNSKIILDALPSSYDFPALASSLEKVFSDRQYKVSSLTGTDDQLAQQGNTSSVNPAPVPMPFSVGIAGANYDTSKNFIDTLLTSIRPIQIDTLSISGGGNTMQVNVTAHTYYQPGKSLSFPQETVK